MATYYIDLNAGNDANDGLSTGASWLTIEKYTTVTARTAGDIAYVRANTTEIPAGNIATDEVGTAVAPIQLIGCNATQGIDPWNDGSDVRPIINFNAGAYYYNTISHWVIKNLQITGSTNTWSSGAAIRLYVAINLKIINCHFYNNSTGAYCVYGRGGSSFEDCTFENNTVYHSAHNSGNASYKNCTFTKGADGPGNALYLHDGSFAWLDNVAFVGTHPSADILIRTAVLNRVWGRNVSFTGINEVQGLPGNPNDYWAQFVKIEDYQQVKGAHKAWYSPGIILRDTGETAPSGEYAAKMSPGSYCAVFPKLTLTGVESVEAPAIAIYCLTGIEKTITVKMKGIGWTSFPTNSELYLEAQYLDSGSGGTRTAVQSTQVLSDNTNYVDFTVTFTPSQSGLVYLNVLLGKYAANCGVYVDPKAV